MTTKAISLADHIFPRNFSLTWSPNRQEGSSNEGEGLECFLDFHDPVNIHDYDLTEELQIPKKQAPRLLQVVRRLFPKQRNGRDGKSSIKIKSTGDDASVASTAASTVCPLSRDLDDFDIDVTLITDDVGFTIDTNSAADEVGPGVTSDALLKVLRVFLEYESEKYASIETGFEIVLPGVSDHLDQIKGPADDSLDSASLMQRRLLRTGLVDLNSDFDFVKDHVSKEVNPTAEDMKKAFQEENVTHVKTGVWQVSILDEEGSPTSSPFYVVTGVSMEDRVDTKKLRKAIFEGQSFKRRPKLSIAPTDIAEALTGYQSGTMAPICHTRHMKLFLEENIPLDHGHQINCGSGMFGKCLSISADKFLQIARANPTGIKSCSLVQKKKKRKESKKK